MIFSTVPFLVFFLCVFGLFWSIKSDRWRQLLLLIASYFFYMCWNPAFIALIIVSTAVDYWVGRKMGTEELPRKRKRLLILSLVVNLGLLGFFKYANFFTESSFVVLRVLGFEVGPTPWWDIVLPVGISFYTFQTLSYTCDIYQRRLEPTDQFLKFALFVSFFPQLVAGPIVRARDFLPQLSRSSHWENRRALEGALLFLQGLIKKVVIADRCAVMADIAFEHWDIYGSFTLWLGVIAFTIQIYCDFSGYTDMALGLGRLFGFKLPENFNMPYASTSITDFWRRWHISLSTWLRDYLYIPLGGNRKGRRRTWINLMLTMLLGGLWHGASWTFVIWGGLHGLYLAIHKIWIKVRKSEAPSNRFGRFVSWALTLLSVMVAWVFFRSETTDQAFGIIKKLFIYTPYDHPEPASSLIWIMILCIAAHYVGSSSKGSAIERVLHASPVKQGLAIGLALGLFMLFRQVEDQAFIYFQF